MHRNAQAKRILVIEKQDHWRELAVKALKHAGYEVRSLDTYTYPAPGGNGTHATPDLVILGCPSIGAEERDLVDRSIRHKDHLLVLSTSLPWDDMHALFLQGVEDATEKPYDPDYLVAIVEDVLETILPRSSYRAMEWRR
jgi:DNA-binding NtrC family response regulator